MDAITCSLAYRFVAIAALLVESNRAAELLEWNDLLPITASKLTSQCFVAPPKLVGFAGGLTLDKAFFGATSGRLRYMHRLDAPQFNPELALATNAVRAHALAVLSRFTIAESYLERIGHAQVLDFDQSARGAAKIRKQGEVLVTWGQFRASERKKYVLPIVSLSLSKAGGIATKLRFEGNDLPSEFGKIHIRIVDELLALSDDDFRQAPPERRKDLFERAVGHPLPERLLDVADLDSFLDRIASVGSSPRAGATLTGP